MKKLIVLAFFIGPSLVRATDPYPKNDAIDVLHYGFQLVLNDSSDVIDGQATITLLFKKEITEFELDLTNKNSEGLGMHVTHLRMNGSPVTYRHQHDRLRITMPAASVPGSHAEIIIDYNGIPRDGLIISKNKFGDRTFFGDNWPDRARNWLPSVDHPSDKATCDFLVIAPEQYQVIGNGKKVEECRWLKNQKLTHWQETVPIPTKVMVVGAALFAIQEAGRIENIVVESWVYPQDREAGFSDYACAVKILDFFHHHIGPYPYEKLTSVQSKTRFGAMENASNIFFSESSVNGRNDHEDVIAHEIAHQWFGNSATEKDWHHVWLSEGFATYFSHLYLESAYGHEVLVSGMLADRQQVLNYFTKNQGPVIDTTVVELMNLLSVNSYQKGGWILHMLRHEIGDLAFWDGIRKYYAFYRDGNALTGDFQRIMEEASKKDLTPFFRQWLWKSGHPEISAHWKYNAKGKSILLSIRQTQAGNIFETPLDIAIRYGDGIQIKTVKLGNRSQEYSFPSQNKPLELVLDPNSWLLFHGTIEAR